MPKKNAEGFVRLTVSVSKAEKDFIENNQLSPTKLLKWAIKEKGLK